MKDKIKTLEKRIKLLYKKGGRERNRLLKIKELQKKQNKILEQLKGRKPRTK